MSAHGEPVVVTGLGAVSGLGFGVAQTWKALRAGRVAIGAFDLFQHERHRTHVAAQVPNNRELPHGATFSRADGFALYAAAEAMATARLDVSAAPERVGLFFGTSTAGMLETEHFYAQLRASAPQVRLLVIGAQQNNAPGDAIARRFGIRGPVQTVSAACVSGALALGEALQAIQSGEIDAAIAGGADGLCQLTYAGFNALRAVDPAPCSPFRAARAGLSLGEGAGVLVLESRAHALARGTVPLATLLACGSSCDAHHMSAPEPEGKGAARAILQALASAQLTPAAIDFVNVHGTGTPHNDAAEAKALWQVFGERTRRLPITTTKALVGHLLGSCGAFEAVATVLCLRAREVHPTPGNDGVDPALGVDLVVGAPRALAAARTALSTNLAFGGANAALVFGNTP